MQLPNVPNEALFQKIEKIVQPERIGRYLPAAGNDKDLAFKLYMWNCAVSESFYVSLHFSEIA
jgi:hypothetical protein